MVKNQESKIPQFYDILDEELDKTNEIFNVVYNLAKVNGFINVETTKFELQERYLSATKVSSTKIFEVVRPKEKSKFSLQSDLAMSMSRFIADNSDYNNVIKLIQNGIVFRDRVDNIPGYRREFRQILLGTWGGRSQYYDAEIIGISYKALSKFDVQISKIQLSNHDLYNVIKANAAEEIRFSRKKGMDHLKGYLSNIDIQLIDYLYANNDLSVEKVRDISNALENENARKEILKLIKISELLENYFELSENIVFSFGNLDGTNHYSVTNYRIYIKNDEQDDILIADGGRIDNMTQKFNKNKNFPGVCMGIGVQILNNHIEYKNKNKNIKVLVDEDNLEAIDLIKKIELHSAFDYSIYPFKINKAKSFLKSKFYETDDFIIVRDNIFHLKFNDLTKKKIIITEFERLGIKYEIQQVRSKNQ